MPLLLATLLKLYGFRTTLRATTVASCLLTGPLILFMKNRLPPSHAGVVPKTDWSFATKPLFMVYCVSNLTQGLGLFFPSLFLPSYATSLGLSSQKGALSLAVMGFAQMLGQWTFGILSDRLGLNLLIIASTVIAAIAAFISWGLAYGLATLIVFSFLFGFFAYGYSSLRARMGTTVSEEPSASLAMFGILVGCQGVGSVISGPISVHLLHGLFRKGAYGAVKYRSMIIFTGTCMLLSAFSVTAWYARPRHMMTR